MKNLIGLALLLLCLSACNNKQNTKNEKEVSLFSYFKGNGDGLHLAYSEDGLKWEDISDSISFPDGTRHGIAFKVSKVYLEI